MPEFHFLNESVFVRLAEAAWTDDPKGGTFCLLARAERMVRDFAWQSLLRDGRSMSTAEAILLLLNEFAEVESRLCSIRNGDPRWFLPFVAEDDDGGAVAAWNRRNDPCNP